MDEIFKPFLSDTTPSPPKFNVNVTWGALAPMDERNHPPNITFANTCAETLRFGGAGVQQSVCCRVWIFCPSTVSLSDVFTSLGVSWYPNFYCVNTLLHAADLIPNCAKHYLFTGQCNLSVSRPIFFFSLMCNCLQTALGITFWQVNATCVSAVPFFIFPTHAKMRNTLPFERYKLHASLVPFFLSYSFIRNLFQNAADIVFLKVNAVCVGLSRFSLFPTSRWRNGKSCVFPVPCVQGDGMACVFPVPFVRPSSLPVPFPVPFADFLCFSRVCVAILFFAKKN